MGHKRNIIPDAPMLVSMLPTAETLAPDDIIYIVKPNNPAGQRCKKTTSEGTSGTAGYWSGSPSTFVVRHIDVTGILP